MQQEDYLTELLGLQGFFVTDMEINKDGDTEKVLSLGAVIQNIALSKMKPFACLPQ